MAIFIILYGNCYPPNGEFKLICIGKFARRTWVNFTQQYGKNRQRCQQNAFYYAIWQLLLYFYREFPSKILSAYGAMYIRQKSTVIIIKWKKNTNTTTKVFYRCIPGCKHITSLVRLQAWKNDQLSRFYRRPHKSEYSLRSWL